MLNTIYIYIYIYITIPAFVDISRIILTYMGDILILWTISCPINIGQYHFCFG